MKLDKKLREPRHKCQGIIYTILSLSHFLFH